MKGKEGKGRMEEEREISGGEGKGKEMMEEKERKIYIGREGKKRGIMVEKKEIKGK